MKYTFKCNNCGKEKIINSKMSSIKDVEVICDCGEEMGLVFSKNLIVPEHMKAENISQMSNLNSMMSNMPSGKRKAIF